MAELDMFYRLSKVDEEKRLVYGIATAEEEDRSGEICDYASTKPQYEAWSGEMSKVTDGKSLGNLRVMHGKIAAGKLVDLTFNDDARQIEVCAKVVDDHEWKKVLEGVYTGFSQGGAYLRKWKDKETGKTRYTAKPSELSLVDRPCLKSATFFQIQKMDGSVETREFQIAEMEKLEAELDQDIEDMLMVVSTGVALVKFDDASRWDECLEDAERGILETFVKYSDDQPRDSSGKWASAAIGAAIGGAKGAALGALTAGAPGAAVGGIAGAISGAMETSNNHYVRAGGQLIDTVVGAVGVGTIASRLLSGSVKGAAALAATGAKFTAASAETGVSAAEMSEELTGSSHRAQQEKFVEAARAATNEQYEAAQKKLKETGLKEKTKSTTKKMKADKEGAETRSKKSRAKKKDDVAEKLASEEGLEKILSVAAARISIETNVPWQECLEDAAEGLIETMSKGMIDQPRDENGRFASSGSLRQYAVGAAVNAALLGAAGGAIGGLRGAAVGAAAGAVGGALYQSNNSLANKAGSAILGTGLTAVVADRVYRDTDEFGNSTKTKSAIREAVERYNSHPDRAKYEHAIREQAKKMKSNESAAEARKKFKTVEGGKAEKADVAEDLKKMSITNDMVFEKAKELATQAGDVSKTGDYVGQARDILEKKLEKTETPVVEKKPEDWGVKQVWLAKDGSTHDKKSDALAKNETLAAGSDPLLQKIDAALGKSEESEKVSFVEELKKYMGEEVWDSQRAMEAMSTVFNLLSKEMLETEKDPVQVASLQKAIDGLKAFVVSEIQEDNSDPQKRVMALAESITDLAKSDSSDSKAMIQQIHDLTGTLGGSCKTEKSDETGDLAKRAALADELAPRIEKMLAKMEEQETTIKNQGEQLSLLKRVAAPPPRLIVAEKTGEITLSGAAPEANLEKLQAEFNSLTESDKALVMVKFAQSRPQPMKVGG